MRVAIITLPLHTNYGGILQAYSLKTVLESQGHCVSVIDLKDKMPAPKGFKAPFVYVGRILKKFLKGNSGPEVFREKRYARELPILSSNTDVFVQKHISPRMVKSYADIKSDEYDAFVVGSDQVWRPRYFHPLEDAFLAFTKGWDVRRVAYAASFGTDQLEYEYVHLATCSELLEKFDGVSVREDSAVRQCEEWFDCDRAVHVLDPVMLLDPGVYKALADKALCHPAKGRLVTYILDKASEKECVVEFMKHVSGLDVCDVSVYPYTDERPVTERIVPPLEEWLAAFADAEFVVTDSFHGCVLSIMMHKRFIAVGNSRRGMSRLKSLLDMLELDMRLVLLKNMIGLSPKEFIRRVYLNVLAVAAVAVAVPFVFKGFLPEGFWGFCAGVALCVLSASFSILFVGCTVKERGEIAAVVLRRIRR